MKQKLMIIGMLISLPLALNAQDFGARLLNKNCPLGNDVCRMNNTVDSERWQQMRTERQAQMQELMNAKEFDEALAQKIIKDSDEWRLDQLRMKHENYQNGYGTRYADNRRGRNQNVQYGRNSAYRDVGNCYRDQDSSRMRQHSSRGRHHNVGGHRVGRGGGCNFNHY